MIEIVKPNGDIIEHENCGNKSLYTVINEVLSDIENITCDDIKLVSKRVKNKTTYILTVK